MTEKRHRGRQLVVEMRTRATPEQVYEAWADPEKIAHWFVDSARGKAEVGSIFTWVFEKFGYEIPYEVVAAEPGRRFALGGEAPKKRAIPSGGHDRPGRRRDPRHARQLGVSRRRRVGRGIRGDRLGLDERARRPQALPRELRRPKEDLDSRDASGGLRALEPAAVLRHSRGPGPLAHDFGLDRRGCRSRLCAASARRRQPDRARPLEDALGDGHLMGGARRRSRAQGLSLPGHGTGGRGPRRCPGISPPTARRRSNGFSRRRWRDSPAAVATGVGSPAGAGRDRAGRLAASERR